MKPLSFLFVLLLFPALAFTQSPQWSYALHFGGDQFRKYTILEPTFSRSMGTGLLFNCPFRDSIVSMTSGLLIERYTGHETIVYYYGSGSPSGGYIGYKVEHSLQYTLTRLCLPMGVAFPLKRLRLGFAVRTEITLASLKDEKAGTAHYRYRDKESEVAAGPALSFQYRAWRGIWLTLDSYYSRLIWSKKHSPHANLMQACFGIAVDLPKRPHTAGAD